MGALDVAALVVIFCTIIAVTAIVVILGSLPGKITRKRGHPHPDAVNAASWIGLVQYMDGATDYTTVLDTQRSLAGQQDSFASARGSIAQNLVAICRGLGGGWQIREGQDFFAKETRDEMRKRTDWGSLLDPKSVANIPSPDEARKTLRTLDW